MFAKLSALALALPIAVSALTLNTPSNLSSGGTITVTWTSTAGDPATFTLEMINPIFNSQFALANNVQTSLGTTTFELPDVPVGDGYTLEAVEPDNINEVYDTTGDFAVASATVASTTATPTTASTASGSASATTTAPASSGTSASTTGTTTSSSGTPSASSFNAASSVKFSFNSGSAVVVLLSAVVGAAAIF